MLMNVAVALLVLGSAQDSSPEAVAVKKLAADLPQLVKASDADGNGSLNFSEFRSFIKTLRDTGEKFLHQADPTIAEKKAAKDLKKYDVNADGKLDETEIQKKDDDKRRKDIKDFDWNKDGVLNEREKTAMGWAEEGKQEARFNKADGDKDGSLSAEEASAALSDLAGIKIK